MRPRPWPDRSLWSRVASWVSLLPAPHSSEALPALCFVSSVCGGTGISQRFWDSNHRVTTFLLDRVSRNSVHIWCKQLLLISHGTPNSCVWWGSFGMQVAYRRESALPAKRLDAHHFRRSHENPSCYFVPVDHNRGFWTSRRRRLRDGQSSAYGRRPEPPRDCVSAANGRLTEPARLNGIRIGARRTSAVGSGDQKARSAPRRYRANSAQRKGSYKKSDDSSRKLAPRFQI